MQPEPLPNLPSRYLRTPEAAKFLGLSGRTLEKHRTFGTGPGPRVVAAPRPGRPAVFARR